MKAFQIIKKILKYAVYACILFIFLFFFWRIYVSRHIQRAQIKSCGIMKLRKPTVKTPDNFKFSVKKLPIRFPAMAIL